MEIVINDTNILIDLFNAGLLESCKQLNIEFRNSKKNTEGFTDDDVHYIVSCLKDTLAQ